MSSSSKTLRIGIIGCGGIANGKHMPSLKKQPQAEMVAFCDIVQERAEKAAAEFGAEGAKVYTDFRELLKDASIDVIHVCTPNDSHSVISVAALEAGKHVMCEKPMAKTAAEAKEMVDAAKRTGKKLTIGYQNRFRNDSQYLKELCENGELGDIYYGKALAIRRRAVPTWGVFLDEEKQGGGPLIDIGTHALDLTLWLMDNYQPKSVLGSTFHKLGHKENAANAFGPWNPEEFKVEDSAFGFITMQNGATIVLESSWALNVVETGEAKTVLAGTEGGADMKDGLRINGEKMSRLYETTVDLNAGGVAFYSGSAETDADKEQRQWLEAILEDKDPVVKPEQAYVVTQILEAIYESAKTGKAVYFEE
ncbi:putative dehydrogenase [Paenibacillus rhizosphaerae]|uniref:Putative dehydrogenase n=1 Tax=Paenibacillus rhizosphaerae TaxID=297318 RepID=A0A839TQB5_9BACL|nr:Gfo/Idh/MocA family oxidoreductase [Paenibacillus rhizosphaerae]MBB3127509.1 putative dehydrogenase [Paenibacillus rhizosphaerae]